MSALILSPAPAGADKRAQSRRPATPRRLVFLLGFHAVLAGAFAVAWFSGDEDTYRIHLIAGYAALLALTARFAVAFFNAKGPLAWPRPSRRDFFTWIKAVSTGDRGAWGRRSPALAWAAAALLATVSLAALSGLAADFYPVMEDPHEFFANLALAAVIGHVLLLLGLAGLKKAAAVLAVVLAVSLGTVAPQTAQAQAAQAQTPQQKLLAEYAVAAQAADPAFAGFSAERGQALYLGPHKGGPNGGGKPETPACAACHTQDPRNAGRHVSTGRDILPMALSANPKRFTDRADVEKRFARDCPGVLGRDCSAAEKGDFITYLISR